jgi:hypothetical protein
MKDMKDMKGHEDKSDLIWEDSFMVVMPFMVEKSSPSSCRTAAGLAPTQN